jgi:uncharacterized membrane protein YvbJ
MSYCPGCGSKREDESKVCRFCGYEFEKTNETSSKDRRIQELEKKIERLEKGQKSEDESSEMENSPWIFIMPIAITAIFFLFVFGIILITR